MIGFAKKGALDSKWQEIYDNPAYNRVRDYLLAFAVYNWLYALEVMCRETGYFHGDVKEENVLFDDRGYMQVRAGPSLRWDIRCAEYVFNTEAKR